MKSPYLIYLAIENHFMREGVENLILSEIDPEASIRQLSTIDELKTAQFQNQAPVTIFLFFEGHKKGLISNQELWKLHNAHPDVKKIVFMEKFRYQKIKLYFNIGVDAVMDSDISSKEFVQIIDSVQQGERRLASVFQSKVIQQFCEKDKVMKSTDFSTCLEKKLENGKHYLSQVFGITKREKEVLELICDGSNTKEISEKLFISSHTAETHRRKLLQKMDVKNTAELVKVAITNKLILF